MAVNQNGCHVSNGRELLVLFANSEEENSIISKVNKS